MGLTWLQVKYYCLGCRDGSRDIGPNLFTARPGQVQTPREALLSGSGGTNLAKIVKLYQRVNIAEEPELIFSADIQWYDVPRDKLLGHDCCKVYLLKPPLWGCAFTFALLCHHPCLSKVKCLNNKCLIEVLLQATTSALFQHSNQAMQH